MSLSTLFVRDFAIVRHLNLELGPGLTVLTGETGAGKSILVDALTLALGARAETDSIRHGTSSAEVLAGFELDSTEDAIQWLRDQELTDSGECIVRRIIYRDRPTKAFINGRPVTVQTLRELGNLLVDIHGQHEHQSLLRRKSQRQIVDDFGNLNDKVQQLQQSYEKHQQLQSRFESLARQSDDRVARIDLLRYQIGELKNLDLSHGEFRELEREHGHLAHATELTEGMRFASQALYDADDNAANDILAQCIQRLDALVDYADDIFEITSLLKDAQTQMEEAAGQLHRMLGRIELDPQRLRWVEERIGTAVALARKHKCEPDALPETRGLLAQELSDIEDSDTSLERLQQQILQVNQQYRTLAGEVSAARIQAGESLSGSVADQMQELGMTGGRFSVGIETIAAEPTRSGYDRVEFLVSTNSSQPLKPLAKVASGGELSRISLAIQVVVASAGRVPSLIFDEVDVGIGGGVAEVVGQKLRILGRSRQVLCITHLPQVASQAEDHLQVRKRGDGVDAVTITPLDAQARVSEIARMLGGVEISRQTRAHAEDMLVRVSGD